MPIFSWLCVQFAADLKEYYYCILITSNPHQRLTFWHFQFPYPWKKVSNIQYFWFMTTYKIERKLTHKVIHFKINPKKYTCRAWCGQICCRVGQAVVPWFTCLAHRLVCQVVIRARCTGYRLCSPLRTIMSLRTSTWRKNQCCSPIWNHTNCL